MQDFPRIVHECRIPRYRRSERCFMHGRSDSFIITMEEKCMTFSSDLIDLLFSGSSIPSSPKYAGIISLLLRIEYQTSHNIRVSLPFRTLSVECLIFLLIQMFTSRLRFECFLLDFRFIILTRFRFLDIT